MSDGWAVTHHKSERTVKIFQITRRNATEEETGKIRQASSQNLFVKFIVNRVGS